MKQRQKNKGPDKLRRGEVIRVHSKYSPALNGVFKVRSTDMGLLTLSVGEIMMGASIECVEILERNLPEPASWLPLEVTALENQVRLCPCPDCLETLTTKRNQLFRAGALMQ